MVCKENWIEGLLSELNKYECMKLYKEVINGRHITAEEQEGMVFHSNLVEATEEEIKKANEYFMKNKKCLHHFTYDKPSWLYDERGCGICNKFVAYI